jgi:hypothetical protein
MRQQQQKQKQNLPFFGGMFPGQRESRRVDERSEFRLILKQWAGAIVLFALSFLLIVANVLIIGPLVGYIAGIIALFLILIYSYAAVYQQDQPIPTLVAVVGLSIFGFWILAGHTITERFWWPIRCVWEPRNKLLFVIFSTPFILLSFLPIYRFAQEIIDPNWSPTIQIRPAEWGVMWPWSRPLIEDEEPEPHKLPEPEIRHIPRPYQIPTDGTSRTVTDDLDASQVDENKSVIAPSGREVAVKDLVKFVKLAPISGATFRPWQKRRWKYDRWKDVVDIWKIYGVVNSNGERSTTQIVITDLREALERLSSAFVDDRPTPPHEAF